MPSATCSIGMLDQFRYRARPITPGVVCTSFWGIMDMLLFSSRSFQTGSTSGILGLYIDNAILPVFAFAHCRHHPQEVNLSAGGGNIWMITSGHQHAVA